MPFIGLRAAAFALFLANLTWGQAVVNEGQETAFLYVDGVAGNDLNPGTQPLPFKTIGAAIAAAQANNALSIGTKVTINPGKYAEVLSITKSYKSTTLPMTIQAATNGTVTVTGAVPYTGWTTYNGNHSIYTGIWLNRWGYCTADGGNAPYEQPIVLRREMVSVKGAPLTEVLSLSQMIYPGTFFVDENASLIYVWPPSGTNMSTADVEVATQPNLLTINGMSNVVVRGLTFTNANSCHNASAVIVSGKATNVLFDSDNFNWNSGQGLAINNPAASVSVINSVSNHNGASGFQSFESLNTLYQNDTASYNNWRGAQGVYYEWNTGGAHLFADHSQTISGLTAVYNQSWGVHWDTDTQNVTVTGLNTYKNVSGVIVEKAQGPVTISSSRICGSQNTAAGEGGFILRNSQSVSLTNSTLWNNSGAQVLITGVAGGIAVSNWQSKENYNLITKNITFTNNTVEGLDTQQMFKDGYLDGSDWSNFQSTLVSNNNTWWHATNSTPFGVPTPSAGTLLDFTGWKNTTVQDTRSSFAAPAVDPSAACFIAADAPDWQLLADNGALTTDLTGAAVSNLTLNSLGGMTGTVKLSVDGSSMPGTTFSFSPSTATIGGTSALTITTGTSTPAGTYVVTVLANSGNVTRTATINVTVPTQSIRLSSVSLSFLNQAVGTTSPAQVVTVTNVSASTLSITSISAVYGFSETNTCGTSLGVGKSCTISVTFAPHALQTYSSNLTITDSGVNSPQLVGLTGTTIGAAGLSLSPGTLSYGNEVYEKPSASKQITLTNNGTAALSITRIAMTGSNPSDFSQTNTCPASLATNASCTINVTFTPAGSGKRTASVSVTSNAVGASNTVSLSGTETTAISVSPNSLSFGNVKVGVTSASKAITVTNLSTAAIRMTSISISGTSATEFQQTNTCGTSLAGGGACTINVTLKPTKTGSKSATLNINDSDPSGTQTATLSGSGT